jgi:hypothetical protein
MRLNKCNTIDRTKGKWTNKTLEEAMDAIEGGIISSRKASKH